VNCEKEKFNKEKSAKEERSAAVNRTIEDFAKTQWNFIAM
jgi:hypothetical protein